MQTIFNYSDLYSLVNNKYRIIKLAKTNNLERAKATSYGFTKQSAKNVLIYVKEKFVFTY